MCFSLPKSWEEWFLHLAIILWESATTSTFLILYYISFRTVTLLKVTAALVQVCDLLVLKFINLSLQKSIPPPLFGSTVPTLICWICHILIILLFLLIICIKCCMDFLHPPQVLSPSSLIGHRNVLYYKKSWYLFTILFVFSFVNHMLCFHPFISFSY